MPDCLFCNFVDRKLPKDFIFEDSEMAAFRDIHPKAATHLLLIPKRHIPTLTQVTTDDAGLLGRLFYRVTKLAEQEGIDKTGYKIVINTGRHGGQVIDHLHIHLLGGEPVKTLV